VPERLNGPVLKTGDSQESVGSNPTLSATIEARRRPLRVAAIVVVAAALLGIVALASRPTTGGSPMRPLDATPLGTVLEVVVYLTLFIGLTLLALVIRLVGAGRKGPRGRSQGPWWAKVLSLAGAVVVVAGVVWLVATIQDLLLSAPGGLFGFLRFGSTALADAPAGSGTSLLIAIGTFLLLVGAVVVVGLRLRLRDRALLLEAGPASRGVLAQAVDLSLEALLREPDPRRAVIGAYAAMERELASADVPRLASEAPIEYLRRVLGEVWLPSDDVRTLTDLFQVAKFSRHPVDEAMRGRAIASLEQIRSSAQGT
jgi:uncharacterized protein DUF4129